MTKIKICGLTSINDVELINNNKVEYAGFVVFVPKSKRNNDLQNAGVLLKSLDKNKIFSYLNKILLSNIWNSIALSSSKIILDNSNKFLPGITILIDLSKLLSRTTVFFDNL